MGYFTISLPNNLQGEVRWGKVFNKEKAVLNLLVPWKKAIMEQKTGYIVKLRSAFVKETEYKLFQSKEGHWSQDADGRLEVEDPVALAIRKAIEEHEKTSK
jgi:hypothetical protein